MDFDDDSQLDSSQVEDARGGGGGFPGGGLAIGGGAAGIVALIVAVLFGVNIGGGGSPVVAPQPSGDLSNCRTGADADKSQDCRIVGTVNSVQQYWKQEFADSGSTYRPAKTQLFSQATETGCGHATSQVGPFYCPPDMKVYLDLTFFDELQSKFGAKGGPFAQAYVVGHEYGHHIQNLLGTSDKVKQGQTGATSGSVRLELQADCYSGVWAKNASGIKLTDADIREALSAAEAVGDDRIQQRSQGRVNPDGFTHGTSAQREKWFTTGYQTGDPNRCDTFSGGI
jgi:predicted metalloprotease